MMVTGGSRVGLIFSDGSTVDYEAVDLVELERFLETLARLATLDRPNGSLDETDDSVHSQIGD
jgi:uncharacterized protein (DUF2344 family)